MGKCKHTHAMYELEVNGNVVDTVGMYKLVFGSDDNFGYGPTKVVRSARCHACGGALSLGNSYDATEAVQVEIRAAELEPVLHGTEGRVSWAEQDGMRHHAYGQNLNGSDELPGWLAREMATHDHLRETRDAEAWPWDPSRPVAGQYEEWLASKSCAACDTADGCEAHRLLTCSGCGKRVSWDGGAADEQQDVCSDCWNAAQPRIAEQKRHDVAAAVARHAEIEPCPKHPQLMAGECLACEGNGTWEAPIDPAMKFSERAAQLAVHVEGDK